MAMRRKGGFSRRSFIMKTNRFKEILGRVDERIVDPVVAQDSILVTRSIPS